MAGKWVTSAMKKNEIEKEQEVLERGLIGLTL